MVFQHMHSVCTDHFKVGYIFNRSHQGRVFEQMRTFPIWEVGEDPDRENSKSEVLEAAASLVYLWFYKRFSNAGRQEA